MKHLLILLLSLCTITVKAQNCEPITLDQLEGLLSVDESKLKSTVSALGFNIDTEDWEAGTSPSGNRHTLYYKKCLVAALDTQALTLNSYDDGYSYFCYSLTDKNTFDGLKSILEKKAKYNADKKYYYTKDYEYLISLPLEFEGTKRYSICVTKIGRGISAN